jgi:predicted NAD/FAD-binding protein
LKNPFLNWIRTFCILPGKKKEDIGWKKIDQKIYAFKLFNNNATKAKQNIKANHKISGRDFVGTWLCDGCDEKFTFFKDGAFSGNDKNSNLEGRWEYDQQHQLLVYDGRHSKTWRRVDELGEGYFIIGGYYFYKLD